MKNERINPGRQSRSRVVRRCLGEYCKDVVQIWARKYQESLYEIKEHKNFDLMISPCSALKLNCNSLGGNLLDLLKKGAEAIFKHGDKFKSLQHAYLSEDFLENIKSGRVFIPQDALRPFIEKAVEKEDDVSLKELSFTSNHILLILSVRKLGSQIDCPLRLSIISFEINKDNQQITFEYTCDKVVGQNLAGRIVTAIAGGLINRILKEKISGVGASTSIIPGEGNTLCVDLSGVEHVQALFTPIPKIRLCVLDFFNLTGIEHAEEGLLLLGRMQIMPDLFGCNI